MNGPNFKARVEKPTSARNMRSETFSRQALVITCRKERILNPGVPREYFVRGEHIKRSAYPHSNDVRYPIA
jgi:hypothetical protein